MLRSDYLTKLMSLASAPCLSLWTPVILANMQSAHRFSLYAVHAKAGRSLAARQPEIRPPMQT